MDAFDNPAKGGVGAVPHDNMSADQTNQAMAKGEILAAAASATVAASAIPFAIQGVLTPDANGRVVLPAGVSMDDITVSGPDLIIALPNGQVLIIPNGAINIPTIVVEGDTVPASTVAQLLENLLELNPEAGTRSSGGNFADPEGPIQDAYALGNLLPYTELAFPEPRQQEIIPDLVDEEPTTVIVTPDNPAGSTMATASVNEAGLPARGNEPAGSNSAADSESTSGSIVFDVPDGLGSITLNGVAITAVGQVFTTPFGRLVITSIAPGNIGYTYTLTDNTNANNTTADVFAVVVTDSDGDTASANLTISIVDDVPTARNGCGGDVHAGDGQRHHRRWHDERGGRCRHPRGRWRDADRHPCGHRWRGHVRGARHRHQRPVRPADDQRRRQLQLHAQHQHSGRGQRRLHLSDHRRRR